MCYSRIPPCDILYDNAYLIKGLLCLAGNEELTLRTHEGRKLPVVFSVELDDRTMPPACVILSWHCNSLFIRVFHVGAKHHQLRSRYKPTAHILPITSSLHPLSQESCQERLRMLRY